MSMESFLARERKTRAMQEQHVKNEPVVDPIEDIEPTIENARKCILKNARLMLEQDSRVSKKYIDGFLSALSTKADKITDVESVFDLINEDNLFKDYSNYSAKIKSKEKSSKPKDEVSIDDLVDKLVDSIIPPYRGHYNESHHDENKEIIKNNFEKNAVNLAPKGDKMKKLSKETWFENKTKKLVLVYGHTYANKEGKIRYSIDDSVEEHDGKTFIKFTNKVGKEQLNEVDLIQFFQLEFKLVNTDQTHTRYVSIQEVALLLENSGDMTIDSKNDNQLMSELKGFNKGYIAGLISNRYIRKEVSKK